MCEVTLTAQTASLTGLHKLEVCINICPDLLIRHSLHLPHQQNHLHDNSTNATLPFAILPILRNSILSRMYETSWNAVYNVPHLYLQTHQMTHRLLITLRCRNTRSSSSVSVLQCVSCVVCFLKGSICCRNLSWLNRSHGVVTGQQQYLLNAHIQETIVIMRRIKIHLLTDT